MPGLQQRRSRAASLRLRPLPASLPTPLALHSLGLHRLPLPGPRSSFSIPTSVWARVHFLSSSCLFLAFVTHLCLLDLSFGQERFLNLYNCFLQALERVLMIESRSIPSRWHVS